MKVNEPIAIAPFVVEHSRKLTSQNYLLSMGYISGQVFLLFCFFLLSPGSGVLFEDSDRMDGVSGDSRNPYIMKGDHWSKGML